MNAKFESLFFLVLDVIVSVAMAFMLTRTTSWEQLLFIVLLVAYCVMGTLNARRLLAK